MIKKQMKSGFVAEIHDEALIDLERSELDDVVDIVEKCLTGKHFDFQKKVPLKLEWSMGKNYYDLKEI